MRDCFHHYFCPTESELKRLWKDGIFAFDASVLLNVYGYSKETSAELVALLEKIAPRARIPHQFALEFCRNRSVVILKQVSNYNKVLTSLKQIRDVHLAPKREHPFLSEASVAAFETIWKELEDSSKRMGSLVSSDPLAERILAVFNGRVGAAPSEEQLTQMHATAQARYAKFVPPGFADVKDKKPPDDPHGDCVGWLQLIEIAKAEQKGVILITDDFKEDWWRIENERTISPRPELVAEFVEKATQKFYMYTSENFLRSAKEYLAAEIGDKVIEEVSERLASQKLLQREVKSTNSSDKVGQAVVTGILPASPEKVSTSVQEEDSTKQGARAIEPSE